MSSLEQARGDLWQRQQVRNHRYTCLHQMTTQLILARLHNADYREGGCQRLFRRVQTLKDIRVGSNYEQIGVHIW
jgi:hypothetical protein